MLTPNTQAILLLTGHFAPVGQNDVRPLTNREWGRFAYWLKDQGLAPEQLLYGKPEKLLGSWIDSKIHTDRLLRLLNRGTALALAAEKWLRAGLWIMARSDREYPQRLKAQLKNDSPPILFGCGKKSLLNQGGIAVVGSRNATEHDLEYSRMLGARAATQGYGIVSGGARGIDEAAMFGALDIDGTVIGVLADSLLKASSSSRYCTHLLKNNLVLISPFHPESGFNVGNAMQRNKYIYCLADAAVVVHSGRSGGTWHGAEENLNQSWIPLWVKRNDDPEAGNALLASKGARYLEAPPVHLDCGFLIRPDREMLAKAGLGVKERPALSSSDVTAVQVDDRHETITVSGTQSMVKDIRDRLDTNLVDFFDLFLAKMSEWCATQPLSIDELQQLSGLHKSQLHDWLNRALDDGHISKQSRPVRYQWQHPRQEDIFNSSSSGPAH